MTERRQFPKYDCDIFETNGLDDASAIMNLFDKKNRRVNRIFNSYDDCNTEENTQIEEKSYGLHLVSRRDSNADKENLKGTSETSSNKNSIRALSPVDIVVANDEEIREIPKAHEQLKEPVLNTKSKRNNTNLRRSLFNLPASEKRLTGTDLICSTPITQRVHQHENFFNGTETVESLSPICKNNTMNISAQNSKIKETIANNQERENVCVEQIQSLAAIENDLIDQYQIEIEKTPSRNLRRSRISERSHSSQPALSTKGLSASKECSIHIQPMDISEDIISNYRRNQLRRLSLSNQTDTNSIKIIETPLTKRQQSVHCDSVLAKKLQQCETDDSDMALDEAIHQTPVSRASKKSLRSSQRISSQINQHTHEIISNDDCQFMVINQIEKENENKNKKSNALESSIKRNTENDMISDDGDDCTQNQSLQNTSQSKDKNMESKENERENEMMPNENTSEDSKEEENANQNSPETAIFKKPSAMPILSNKGNKITITSNESMDAQVSQSVVESLRKLINENESSSSSSMTSQSQTQSNISRHFNLPKRRKSLKNLESVENYLKVSKKNKTIKKKKEQNRQSKRRTLFTDTSIIEENNENQQLQEPLEQADSKSDHEIRTTVDEICKSLDSMSNASSEFYDEIPCKTPTVQKQRSRLKKLKEVNNEKNEEKPGKSKKRVRTLPDSNDESPKQKKKKNIQKENVHSDSDSDDEGFGSDVNIRNDIKYDPNTNNCLRKGLRVRRYPRPWWRHDADADNYGLVYRCYNRDDYFAELKLKKKSNVQGKKDTKEKNRMKKKSTDSNSVKKTQKPIKPLATINEDENSGNESNFSESLSTCTFATAISRSETIKKVFDSYTFENNENIPSKTKSTDSYDLQQINKLEWTECGTNILYHQFINNKNDGFIKFQPGAKKSKAKTKRSILKFVLLSGKIDFYVNDEVETLEHLGYISIQPGNIYSVQNPYDQPAILTFTKLESPESD